MAEPKKPLKLAFSTFLKLSALTPGQKIREFQKYVSEGSGYDFYRVLKKAIREHALGQTSEEDVKKLIAGLKSDREREHNSGGFKAYIKWRKTVPTAEFLKPRKGKFPSPGGLIEIRLEPELEYKIGSELFVSCVWNTAKPKLTSAIAGMGLRMLQQKSSRQGVGFQVLNLRTLKSFTTIPSGNIADVQLNAELAMMESIWKQLNG